MPDSSSTTVSTSTTTAADPATAQTGTPSTATLAPPAPGAMVLRAQGGTLAPPPPTNHIPIFFTDPLPPGPTGSIDALFHNISLADQRTTSEALYSILWDTTKDLSEVNALNVPVPVLLQIPETSMLKVMFAAGFGTTPVGTTSPIQNKLLLLAGDGDSTLGPPEVSVFEAPTLRDRVKLLAADDNTTQAAITAKGNVDYQFLLRPTNITDTVTTMRLAPFPHHLALDGLHRDIPAVEMYERLLLSTHRSPMMNHAIEFCRAALIGPLRNSDKKGYIPPSVWSSMAPIQAKHWRKQQCEKLFPSLFPSIQVPILPTAPNTAPAPAPSTAPAPAPSTAPAPAPAPASVPVPPGLAPPPPSGIPLPSPFQPSTAAQPQPFDMQQALVQALLLQLQNQQRSTVSFQEEKKSDEPGPPESVLTKVSEYETKLMKILCNIPDHVDESAFPSWYLQILRKNLSKHDKDLIVAEALTHGLKFEDAPIPIYPGLKNTVRERNWTGGEAGGTPLYSHACLGLTVFAMADLSENDKAQMEFAAQYLHGATHITTEDVKSANAKLVAKVPEDGTKWRNMLLQLTNLLLNLFHADCEMYKEMAQLVKTIRQTYNIDVLNDLPMTAKAAILWIVHLQCRHFAQGKMIPGTKNCLLPAFSWMVDQIQSGQIHMVTHAGVPNALKSSSKRKIDQITPGNDLETEDLNKKTPKKEKVQHPWNEKLKKMMAGPLRKANNPTFKSICRYCKLGENDSVVPAEKNQCRNYLIFGRCRYGKSCKFAHDTASDAQADAILEKLQPFLNNPEEVGPSPPFSLSSLVVDTPSSKPPENPVKSPEHPPKKTEYRGLPANIHAKTPVEQDLEIDDAFAKMETIPDVAKERIGKTMWPSDRALDHPAGYLLEYWAKNGCPVDCGEPWTRDVIEAAIKRGPHASAKSPAAIEALIQETHDKVAGGYARLVRWGDICDDFPKFLKISPLAAVPHKSRLFRMILDLSFRLRYKGKKIPSVNSATKLQAPAEAMVQLGFCIKRLIATLADNYDPDKPFVFSKLDIKDGFWRLAVSDEDAWNFCYVMPSLEPKKLEDEMIVVPNSLQMGWCESPPYFCAATETARDVIESLLLEAQLPEHELEPYMLEKAETLHRLQAATTFTTLLEVFVDDFCAATNNLDRAHLEHFSRAMLHGIHTVFPPPQISGHNGEDPVSVGKLKKGEGTWDTTKEILGWIIDGANYTIKLPEDKCDRIIKQIKNVIRMKACPLKEFQSLAGRIQHASLGTPGGKGLFSPLYVAMQKNPCFVQLTQVLKQILRDWRALIREMKENPSHVCLLVTNDPNYLNFTDACGLGAGGVISSGNKDIDPIVWQFEWPDEIKKELITAENPSGTITINDLELAGMLLGWLILELSPAELSYAHVGTFCDNTSAVSWATKGQTSKSIPAARLLRFLFLRQRIRRTSSLVPLHLSGDLNIMADVSSRAFKNGEILEAIPRPNKVEFASDFLLAWQAIANGTTRQTSKNQEKYWKHWCSYVTTCKADPYLETVDSLTGSIIATGFAARVRSGVYGRGKEVKVHSVTDALTAVSTTCELVGKQSPFLKAEATYLLPIKRCIEGLRREDAPPVPQLAVPIDVPVQVYRAAHVLQSSTPAKQAMGDLALIGFYYLLRSGEYTKPRFAIVNGKKVSATRTKQFRVKDVGFFKDGKILKRSSPLSVLLTADSATLKITNQKSGRMGETIHQETTGELGGVCALARRVHHILSHGGNGNNLICDYYVNGVWSCISATEMIREIRYAAVCLNLKDKGIEPDLIGNHSLRAGGAMALKLNKYPDSTIQKIGRWKSSTWLMYMHNQIAHMSSGVASAMSKPLPFLNIGYIEASDSTPLVTP